MVLHSLFDGVSGLSEEDEARCGQIEALFAESEEATYVYADQARKQTGDQATFAYGEIMVASFVAFLREVVVAMEKNMESQGDFEGPRAFWDLGSGAGKAVIAAHCMVHGFERR